MEENIISTLANHGFSAVVAGYVLFSVNKTLGELVNEIREMKIDLKVITKEIDKIGEK